MSVPPPASREHPLTRWKNISRLLLSGLFLSLIGVACKSSERAPNNGVNDVRKACEARLSWKGATTLRCSYCLAAAANPPCACSSRRDFSGRCEKQQSLRSAEPSCEGVEECRFRCAAADCGCVEACYAKKEACRAVASALDGCIADVCAAECSAP